MQASQLLNVALGPEEVVDEEVPRDTVLPEVPVAVVAGSTVVNPDVLEVDVAVAVAVSVADVDANVDAVEDGALLVASPDEEPEAVVAGSDTPVDPVLPSPDGGATAGTNTEKWVVDADTCVESTRVPPSETKSSLPAGAVMITTSVAWVPGGS